MANKFDPILGEYRQADGAGSAFTTGDGYNFISAGTQQAGTGAVVRFSDSNNVSFGMSNNSVVTASASYPAQTAFQLSNSNGISFGTNGSTVTASYTVPTVPTQTANVFSNSNGISFGTNGSTVTASYTVPNVPAQTSLSFANSNGVTFGTNGSTLTASVATNYQSQGAYLTTAQPVGAYLTTAALSNHSHGNPTLALTNLTGTTASASNGLTISLSAAAPGGGGDGYNIIGVNGGATALSTTIQFSNSNNVSFGLNAGTITASASYPAQTVDANKAGTGFTSASTAGTDVVGTLNTNGLSVGIPKYLTTAQPVGAYLTTARASNDAIGLNTALTGNGVSMTANSSGLSLNVPAFLTTAMQSASSSVFAKTGFTSASTAGSDMAVTLNTNGLSVGMPKYLTTAQPTGAYLTTAMASNANTSFVNASAAFAGTNASGTIASNGISVSVAAPGGGAAPAAQASNGSFTFNTIGFSNANNVTFGTSAGSIITASVAAPGGGAQATATMWYPYNEAVNVLGVQGNATWQFAPVPTPMDRGAGVVSVDRAVFPMFISNATNVTGSVTVSLSMGLYTLTASSLSMAYSASGSFGLTYSGTVRNSVNSGIRLATIPFNTVIDADRYYVGIAYRSTTGGGNATVNQVLVSQLNSNFSGLMGEASNRSHQWPLGLGVRSASSSGFFSSIAFSQIDGTGSLAARPPSWHMRLGTV